MLSDTEVIEQEDSDVDFFPSDENCSSEIYKEENIEVDAYIHDLGRMNVKCHHCKALMFLREKTSGSKKD